MLREDSTEVSKYAADRLGPGTELKPLDRQQPEIQNTHVKRNKTKPMQKVLEKA